MLKLPFYLILIPFLYGQNVKKENIPQHVKPVYSLCEALKLPGLAELYKKLCINKNQNTHGNSECDESFEILNTQDEYLTDFFIEMFQDQNQSNGIEILKYNETYLNVSVGNKECSGDDDDDTEEYIELTNIEYLCPWHTIIQYRPHLYPKLRSQVICNCQNCNSKSLTINEVPYVCKQVFKLKPVLIRGDCVNNNKLKKKVYETKRAYEYVSVACSCMASFETDDID